MQIFRHTFGSGQVNAGKCQPIMAANSTVARAKMFDMFGAKWGFQYSEEEWQKCIDNPDRWWRMETELPLVTVNEEVEELQ